MSSSQGPKKRGRRPKYSPTTAAEARRQDKRKWWSKKAGHPQGPPDFIACQPSLHDDVPCPTNPQVGLRTSPDIRIPFNLDVPIDEADIDGEYDAHNEPHHDTPCRVTELAEMEEEDISIINHMREIRAEEQEIYNMEGAAYDEAISERLVVMLAADCEAAETLRDLHQHSTRSNGFVHPTVIHADNERNESEEVLQSPKSVQLELEESEDEFPTIEILLKTPSVVSISSSISSERSERNKNTPMELKGTDYQAAFEGCGPSVDLGMDIIAITCIFPELYQARNADHSNYLTTEEQELLYDRIFTPCINQVVKSSNILLHYPASFKITNLESTAAKQVTSQDSDLLYNIIPDDHEAECFIWRLCCQGKLFKSRTRYNADGDQVSRASKRTVYPFATFRDSCDQTIFSVPNSPESEEGLIYTQLYTLVKIPFDAAKTYVFDNDVIENLALDLGYIRSLQQEGGGITFSLAVCKFGYLHSKQRVHVNLIDSQWKSYGVREEYRVLLSMMDDIYKQFKE
ncbi:hypothetical protein B7463_g11374, partial [Scytalidium lignicola]